MRSARAAALRALLLLGACGGDASAAAGTDRPELDRMVEDAVQRYRLPGIAVGVIEDGAVVYLRTTGELAAGRGEAVTPDTLFKIASNSKAMTTALLARLVDQGRLAWDDPVVKHLPQLRMQADWVTREIQVRDLLIHNSGLGLGAGDLMLWPEPNAYTRDDVIAALAHLTPTHSFRAHYAYDNILYIVAGEVAAAAGGAPYETLLRRELFEPLGMARCQGGGFDLATVGNVAQPHMRDGERNVVIREDAADVATSTAAAAGGIRCSLADMLRWAQAWLAPDAAQRAWLTEAQRAALWTPHMPLPLSAQTRAWEDANFLSYGYGWRLSDANGQLKVAHTGTLAGMYSVLTLLPETRTGWVILINGEGSAARAVLNQVLLKHYTDRLHARTVAHYALQLERSAASAPAASAAAAPTRRPALAQALDDRLGVYRDAWFGDVSICADGPGIQWRAHKSPRLRGPLLHAGDGLLVDWIDPSVDAEPWLHFARAGDGTPTLTMTHVDPDADFSYDYGDLAFTRVGACD